MITYFVRQF